MYTIFALTFPYGIIFIYFSAHMMWHTHEPMINVNQCHLILAPHFHLSERGYVAAYEWMKIHLIKMDQSWLLI